MRRALLLAALLAFAVALVLLVQSRGEIARYRALSRM